MKLLDIVIFGAEFPDSDNHRQFLSFSDNPICNQEQGYGNRDTRTFERI